MFLQIMKNALIFSACAYTFSAYAMRCDTSEAVTNPTEIYIDNGDGTVTDTRTGLMWKKCVEGLKGDNCRAGRVAKYYASVSRGRLRDVVRYYAGYDDWRVPTAGELQSLIEYCKRRPAINVKVFPNTPTRSVFNNGWYITSTQVFRLHATMHSFYEIMLVDFHDADVYVRFRRGKKTSGVPGSHFSRWFFGTDGGFHLRLVRGPVQIINE